MTLVRNSLATIRVLVRSTFDPTGLGISSAVLGPDGAGIESAEWGEGIWAARWVDGMTAVELFHPREWSSWNELWVRVQLCQPVPVGRLAAITRTGVRGGG